LFVVEYTLQLLRSHKQKVTQVLFTSRPV